MIDKIYTFKHSICIVFSGSLVIEAASAFGSCETADKTLDSDRIRCVEHAAQQVHKSHVNVVVYHAVYGVSERWW